MNKTPQFYSFNNDFPAVFFVDCMSAIVKKSKKDKNNPQWCRASCPRMSVDILGTNCDQFRSMVQCCFTSTETIRLIRTESAGRPPRLPHSSWTLAPSQSSQWQIYPPFLAHSVTQVCAGIRQNQLLFKTGHSPWISKLAQHITVHTVCPC